MVSFHFEERKRNGGSDKILMRLSFPVRAGAAGKRGAKNPLGWGKCLGGVEYAEREYVFVYVCVHVCVLTCVSACVCECVRVWGRERMEVQWERTQLYSIWVSFFTPNRNSDVHSHSLSLSLSLSFSVTFFHCLSLSLRCSLSLSFILTHFLALSQSLWLSHFLSEWRCPIGTSSSSLLSKWMFFLASASSFTRVKIWGRGCRWCQRWWGTLVIKMGYFTPSAVGQFWLGINATFKASAPDNKRLTRLHSYSSNFQG